MKQGFRLALIVLVVGMVGLTIYNMAVLWETGQAKKNNNLTAAPVTVPPGYTLVEGYNYGFSPAEITVKEGEEVKLTLRSGDSPHTFTIDGLNVDKYFTYGKDEQLTFTASKKGTYQIYCAVPGHAEDGMIGTLNVI